LKKFTPILIMTLLLTFFATSASAATPTYEVWLNPSKDGHLVKSTTSVYSPGNINIKVDNLSTALVHYSLVSSAGEVITEGNIGYYDEPRNYSRKVQPGNYRLYLEVIFSETASYANAKGSISPY
jgi:hypothetical protein